MTKYGKEFNKHLPGLSLDKSSKSHLTVTIKGLVDEVAAYISPKEVKALTIEMLEWLGGSHLTLGDLAEDDSDCGASSTDTPASDTFELVYTILAQCGLAFDKLTRTNHQLKAALCEILSEAQSDKDWDIVWTLAQSALKTSRGQGEE